MNRLGTIIGFTYKQKAKTKAFKVTTLILVILMTIGMNLPYIISSFNGEEKDSGGAKGADISSIGLVISDPEQQGVGEELKLYTDGLINPVFKLVSYESADESKLSQDVNDGIIDGYVTLENMEGSASPLATYYSSDGDVSSEVITWLQLAIQNAKTKVIAQNSLTEQQIADISTPVSLITKEINVDNSSAAADTEDAASKGVNYAFVYVLMILFFFSTVMTGNMIASEITAEKSSRIMEILITSVSPLTQMFGKIIGIFLLSLTQIGIFGLTIFVNLMLPHNKEMLSSMNIDLTLLNLDVLFYGLVFYIFGYFLYAVLFAAIGSIVSRTEDLGQALTPMTMLSLAAFYIGIFSMGTPNSLLVQISSYVPFTAPTVMILRVGMGEIAVWQIWVSLVILIAAILGFGWLSAKIYRTGVLMYGKRPSVAELRKAMKAFKM